MKVYQKEIRKIVCPDESCIYSTGYHDKSGRQFVFSDGHILVAIPDAAEQIELVNGIAEHKALMYWRGQIRMECVDPQPGPDIEYRMHSRYVGILAEIGQCIDQEITWDVEDQGDFKPVLYTWKNVTVAIMKTRCKNVPI